VHRSIPWLWLAFAACGGDKDGGGGEDADADTDTDSDTDADTDADTDTVGFTFLTDDPSTYNRVDRMGMPAIATAVITSKDAYNAANPADDVTLAFAGEITTNVAAIHSALDDDLTGLGLTPCEPTACVGQAAPAVIPDALSVDTTAVAGFPNGRMLADPVIDITLALVLLDLGTHGADTFAGLPLNPPANDLTFPADFPHLAPAH